MNFVREKVNIPPFKSFITIEGAGAAKTIVQWGDTAQTPGPKGQPIGTFASATFAVNSPYFLAKNITFKVMTCLVMFLVFVFCFRVFRNKNTENIGSTHYFRNIFSKQ